MEILLRISMNFSILVLQAARQMCLCATATAPNALPTLLSSHPMTLLCRSSTLLTPPHLVPAPPATTPSFYRAMRRLSPRTCSPPQALYRSHPHPGSVRIRSFLEPPAENVPSLHSVSPGTVAAGAQPLSSICMMMLPDCFCKPAHCSIAVAFVKLSLHRFYCVWLYIMGRQSWRLIVHARIVY